MQDIKEILVAEIKKLLDSGNYARVKILADCLYELSYQDICLRKINEKLELAKSKIKST